MSSAPPLKPGASEFGSGRVLSGEAAQAFYGPCTSGFERIILGAVRPLTTEDVVAIVKIAGRFHIPLYPISTGHNWGYGTANPASDGCVILDLSGLDRIIDIDAELGLVTLEPGVTQGALRAYLDRNGLPFLVPVTGAGPECSIVGNALERGYGITPITDHFAAVTAIEAILADGSLYRSALSEFGGEEADRAFKWGIGPYLDGLFAQGNFGIVIRMTIALASRPEAMAAFLFRAKEPSAIEDLVRATREILRAAGSVVGAINLMNARRILAMTVPYPDDLVTSNGALSPDAVARLSSSQGVTAWTGFGALYGSAKVVRAARGLVRDRLGPVVSRLNFVTPERAAAVNRWARRIPGLSRTRFGRMAATLDSSLQLIAGIPSEVALPLAYWRSGTKASETRDPARDGCGLIWYPPLVPMRPERVGAYVRMVEEICLAHALEPLITLTSLSDRCFDSSVPLLFRRDDPAQVERALRCYEALFEAGRREGFLPYRIGVHAMERITHSGTPFWATVAKLKAALDPDGIIAPGRYAP